MHQYSPTNANETYSLNEVEYLFGWDLTPGIVSVWANREGLVCRDNNVLNQTIKY